MEKQAKINQAMPILSWIILVVTISLVVGQLFLPVYWLPAALLVLGLFYLTYRQPFFGILLVIFSLPLERIGAWETGLGTIRLSQVFVVITFLAWLLNSLSRKKVSMPSFPLAIPLALFTVINLYGLLNAVNLSRSVLVLSITLLTFLGCWLMVALVRKKVDLQKVVFVLLISASLVSLFGLYQFFGDMLGLPSQLTGLRDLYTKDVLGFTRVQSTALEPLYFANFLLIPLSLLYALFLSSQAVIKKWLVLILIILLGINLFLTVSRGGYLALFGSIILITILYLRNFFTSKKIFIFLLIVVLLYVVGSQFVQIGGSTLNWETFVQHVGGVFSGPSYLERLDTFNKAYQLFSEHPLIGIGPGSFGPAVAVYSHILPTGGWQIVNNESLELLTETGLLGFLSLVIVFIILLVRTIKAINICRNHFLQALMSGFLGAFIAVLIQYQTFSILYIMHIWILFGLMIACQNIIFKLYRNQEKIGLNNQNNFTEPTI